MIALRAAGETKLGIARHTGLDRRTVDLWLAAGHFPERAPMPPRATCTDAFAEFLATRIAAGEVNAVQLTRELIARAYQGSDQAVRRAVARERVRRPSVQGDAVDGITDGTPVQYVAPPSPRQAA